MTQDHRPFIADGRIRGGVRVSTVTLSLLFLITLLGYLAARPEPPEVQTVTGVPSSELIPDGQTQIPTTQTRPTTQTPTTTTPTTTAPSATPSTEAPTTTEPTTPTVPGIPGLPLPQIPGINPPPPTPTAEPSATPTP